MSCGTRMTVLVQNGQLGCECLTKSLSERKGEGVCLHLEFLAVLQTLPVKSVKHHLLLGLTKWLLGRKRLKKQS